MTNDNTPALSPVQMHVELVKALADIFPSNNAVELAMKTLVDDGWIVPGIPPCRQVLADARQFHDELILTKLVARFFRVIILGAVIIPETPATMDWLRDYIDGTHTVHGPLGRPMLWPDRLPTVVSLLRDWGFQPTPTNPKYVSMRPGGKMLDLDMPEPDAPDPRMAQPIDADMEIRMGSILDGFTQGVSCAALDRTTVIRAMIAAQEAPRRALLDIVALMGNVDHDKPGGPNDAAMRGGMLMDVKRLAESAL